MAPIGNAKVGNVLEIPKIGREKERLMNESYRRDLKVHRTDANTLLAKTWESRGRLIIKGHHLPT